MFYNSTMKTLMIFISIFASSLAFAIDIALKSEDTQTQVIELYTSEGCSSCPPADRWLTSLKTNPQLFKGFIPLAFHVDYWDYIGWKDELALPENSMRQRFYKLTKNLNSVYTPGILKAGQEWRGWFGSKISSTTNKVGSLSLEIKNNTLKAQFDALSKDQYILVVALLGMNIETKVMAGENHGKNLSHDFVVLKKHRYKVTKGEWDESIDQDFFQSNHSRTAFVAWIEQTNNATPIQAVGTFL